MKKILIIESNTSTRTNLKELLILVNYQVITMDNGQSGIEAARKELPDMILCDVLMPDTSGYDVFRTLRNTPETAETPFIFLKADAELEDLRKGMECGADDFISIPFDPVNLLDTIDTRLEKRERIRRKIFPETLNIKAFIHEDVIREEFEKLLQNKEVRRYKKRDFIFTDGDFPRWVNYIQKGKVKLMQTSANGKEFITGIYREGDFFGYLCALKNVNRFETAVAMQDSEILLIPREEFTSLVFGNPDVALRFVRLLANQVADQEEQLLGLAYNSVRKRLADMLVHLSRENNEIQIHRDDLASLIGTAKETIIRTLADFRDEKLIDTHENAIHIINLEKLVAMPN